MKLEITYLSVLSSVTGKKSEVLELKDRISIAEVIELLAEKYSHRFRNIVYMDSSSRKYLVSFLVNKVMADDDYVLQDGDELTILLALGGG